MEKVEIQIPGKWKKWQFTETEKHEIRRTLRNEAPENDIEIFISHLEFFCNGKKELLEQPPKIDIRATREIVLRDCKAVLRQLRQIQRGKMQICQHETLANYGDARAVDPVGDFLMAGIQSAWEAIGPLEKFVKVIEGHHLAESKKVGHPKADADHFIRKIRDIYIEHIEKPTAYETGAFFTIVKVILEIFGLPYADPSRAIKSALKSK